MKHHQHYTPLFAIKQDIDIARQYIEKNNTKNYKTDNNHTMT